MEKSPQRPALLHPEEYARRLSQIVARVSRDAHAVVSRTSPPPSRVPWGPAES